MVVQIFEIDTRSLKLAYAVPKTNVPTAERALTIHYVKPVASFTELHRFIDLWVHLSFLFTISFFYSKLLKKWRGHHLYPPTTQTQGSSKI